MQNRALGRLDLMMQKRGWPGRVLHKGCMRNNLTPASLPILDQ